MGIIAFLIVGLIAGLFAGRIVDGHGFGVFGDIVIGVTGSFIGGLLFSRYWDAAAPNGFWSSVVVATLGASVLLIVVNFLGAMLGSNPKKI